MYPAILPRPLLLGIPFLFALSAAAEQPALTIAVMDPLAAPLACACVMGHGQRKYEKLAEYLSASLKQPFKVAYGEDLVRLTQEPGNGPIGLVIGKRSVIEFDAAKLNAKVRPLAMLTGRDGTTVLRGLFIVARGDRAQKTSDLKGYKILFGPLDSTEKHAAALAALKAAGVTVAEPLSVAPGCSDGALAVQENKTAVPMATVISTYAMPLLEGCGTVEKGSLRIVGQTEPVPFIAVFATAKLPAELDQPVTAALLSASKQSELLSALESRDGFVAMLGNKAKQ